MDPLSPIEALSAQLIQTQWGGVFHPMMGAVSKARYPKPFRRPPHRLLVGLFALALLSHPGLALARHPEIVAEIGEPRRLGAARYKVLSWSVFDAELWAADPAFSWGRPFALSLTYKRDISASALVARSLSGMEQRTRFDQKDGLATLLQGCFADVRAGDRFTGISLDENRARFYLNGRETCEIFWTGFRRAFFGIWLDGRGGDRAFSIRLTGGHAPRSAS